jgi:WD40 repeat protein
VTASRDHTARIWNAATGKPVGAVLQHQEAVTAVAWSPDGARIATASADHTVRVWDAATGAPVGGVCRHGDDVLAVAFSPDSRWLASGGKDGVAKLWEASTGELAGFCRQSGWATAVAFSPDGRRLAVAAGAEHGSQLWDISTIAARVRPLAPPETGQAARMMAAHPGDERRMASTSGEYMAVRDGGDLVQIWAVREGVQVGEPLHVGSGVTWLQFSPDDRTLFAGGKDRAFIQAWDTAYLAARPTSADLVRDAALRTRYHTNRLGYPEPHLLASF